LPGIDLRPWRPATDLPESETDGSKVQLPAPCGKHHVYYQAALRWAAMRGLYHYFDTACDCGKAYLVRTETDGEHFKAEGEGPAIDAAYEAIQGDEMIFQDGDAEFACKRLPQLDRCWGRQHLCAASRTDPGRVPGRVGRPGAGFCGFLWNDRPPRDPT